MVILTLLLCAGVPLHGPEDQGLEAWEDQPAGLRKVGLRERRLEGEIINY